MRLGGIVGRRRVLSVNDMKEQEIQALYETLKPFLKEDTDPMVFENVFMQHLRAVIDKI